jgi:hypothetical protein
MHFLLPSIVTATMLIATSAIGSKAEAAMMPGLGTLPVQTKSYTPVEKVYWRRAYRRGYYGYGYPGYAYPAYPYYGYAYPAYPYYGYGYRPYYGWGPGITIGIGPRWGWGY